MNPLGERELFGDGQEFVVNFGKGENMPEGFCASVWHAIDLNGRGDPKNEIVDEIYEAATFAVESPYPDPEELYTDVYV